MHTVLIYCGMGLAAYLIGAVPFGFLISRMNGVDIRKVGSGNIGATNVFRSVGKSWGVLTFACDFLKGLLPVLLLPAIACLRPEGGDPTIPRLVCAACSIAGHNWTVFLRFRGGKGVATSAGALLGVAWAAVAAGLVVWISVFLLTRYVSVASMAAAAAMVAASWIWLREPSTAVPVVLTVLGGVAIIRHKSNIARLLHGTEHRAEFRKRDRKA